MTLLSGCDDPGVDVDARVEFRDSCPVWRCGFNSAEVNGRAIRELNLDGLPNDDGVRIVGFIAPAGLLGNFSLDTEGDALVARNPQGTVLRGAQLIGATILVKPPGLLALPVPITILNYQEIDAWAAGAPKVPTYALLYPDVGALLGVHNVCSGDLLDTLIAGATVIAGETYDLDTKTVEPDRPRWITIACAGSAAAKLRLLNYGPHGDFDGEGNPATVEQRQATLKMLTADYCGTGQAYTQNDTPLEWANASGTVDETSSESALEAIWTAEGALCLDTTRLPDPDIACTLPPCDAFSLADGEWLTRVPP
ncbi:MAG TPA: ADYC domain-containing protein [Nannocystis sp.]